jgi:hypothetical protein
MPNISTPNKNARNGVRKGLAQPSEATLNLLRNYARTYVPAQEANGKSKAELFN